MNFAPLTQQELADMLFAKYESARLATVQEERWKKTPDGRPPFGVISTRWEEFFAGYRKKHIKQIFRVAKERGLVMLDQGCGGGTTLVELVLKLEGLTDCPVTGYGVSAGAELANSNLRQGLQYLGTDGRTTEYATPKGNTITIIEGDLHFCPQFLGRKFDFIFSHWTYMHLALPWFALEQTLRLLKPDGVALIDEINKPLYTQAGYYAPRLTEEVFDGRVSVLSDKLTGIIGRSRQGHSRLHAGKIEGELHLFTQPAQMTIPLAEPTKLYIKFKEREMRNAA